MQLPQLDMTGRVQGDTMVISPADLAAQTTAPLGGTPAPSVPVAPVAPAPAPAAIPTLGGSFTDTGSAVSAAWAVRPALSRRCWMSWLLSLPRSLRPP